MEISANLSSSSRSRLVLISTGPAAHLAAETLAQHLGITPLAAAELLGKVPAVLAESLEPELASQLANLLRSFGLRVRLDQTMQSETLWDLSIQLLAAVRLQRTVRIVAEQTGLPQAEVEQRVSQPGGIVLSGLRRDEVDSLQVALGRLGNLLLIESDPASAVYDLFLSDGQANEALGDRLRLMGAEADPITGAIAAGLDQGMCAHLQSRAPQRGMRVLNRAFQRYDMYLSRATGWVTTDLADFLVARTGMPRSRFEVLSERLPLRIEFGLTYSSAKQFRADYASIGLHTFLVLSGLVETADNSNL